MEWLNALEYRKCDSAWLVWRIWRIQRKKGKSEQAIQQINEVRGQLLKVWRINSKILQVWAEEQQEDLGSERADMTYSSLKTPRHASDQGPEAERVWWEEGAFVGVLL